MYSNKCIQIFLIIILPLVTILSSNFNPLLKDDKSINSVGVYDYAHILSETEEEELLNKAYKLSDYTDIYVLTVDYNPYGRSEDATDKYCNQFYINYTTHSNNVLILCIDMYTQYVFMYSCGDYVQEKLTDHECNRITGEVYTYADKGMYAECLSLMIEKSGELLCGEVLPRSFLEVYGFLIIGGILFIGVDAIIISYKIIYSKKNN